MTRSFLLSAGAALALGLAPFTLAAQGRPGGRRGPAAPLAVPHPHYVSIAMQMEVNRPAAEVWARVGKFCDIADWFQISCQIQSGTEGELGEVRALANGAVLEVMVGKTPLSYTYTQPVRVGTPYNLYHGTLEARPLTATTSELYYTLVFDNSALATEAARAQDIANRRTRFMQGLRNMKTLAEGGTLPQPAARGRRGAGAPAPAGR